MSYSLHQGTLSELSGQTWHGISRLRQDVFIVEQDCPYPDQDDRDAEPDTIHLWLECEGKVVATLRVLVEPDGVRRRIGRVATAVDHRGQGLMGRLLREGIELCGSATIEIEAQSYLQAWYEGFGFVRVGDEFLEDGIPHVPMRRKADQSR